MSCRVGRQDWEGKENKRGCDVRLSPQGDDVGVAPQGAVV